MWKLLIKQTVLIFLLLLAMVAVSAGIFLIILKSTVYNLAEVPESSVVDLATTSTLPVPESTLKNIIVEVPVIYEEEIVMAEEQEEVVSPDSPAVQAEDPVTTTPVTPPVTEKPSVKETVLLAVPFTSQAPFGDWSDPRQDAGCEEASLLMAVHWITGEKLTPDVALRQITAMADYQLKNYGHFHDSSIADTLKLLNDYFGYHNAFVEYDIDGADIRHQLDLDRVVIVPVNGIVLANPFFTPPGPPVHQLIVIGYDESNQQFITHDPGTRRGANYRYSYKNLTAALGDYLTGYNEPLTYRRTAMLVIEKEQ